MSIEAMKQAIEAWGACGRYPDATSDIERLDVAINALRTAIQQAEAQQPATAIACGIPGMAKTTCPYCEQGFAFEHEQPATDEPVADGVPDGVHWFTVTQDGMPDFGEEVIGGFWYTDPWLKPDCATRFMWGQCRVVKDDHRDFKDGKRWQTFGPSHNDITHWARLKSPAHHTANQESQNGE